MSGTAFLFARNDFLITVRWCLKFSWGSVRIQHCHQRSNAAVHVQSMRLKIQLAGDTGQGSNELFEGIDRARRFPTNDRLIFFVGNMSVYLIDCLRQKQAAIFQRKGTMRADQLAELTCDAKYLSFETYELDDTGLEPVTSTMSTWRSNQLS